MFGFNAYIFKIPEKIYKRIYCRAIAAACVDTYRVTVCKAEISGKSIVDISGFIIGRIFDKVYAYFLLRFLVHYIKHYFFTIFIRLVRQRRVYVFNICFPDNYVPYSFKIITVKCRFGAKTDNICKARIISQKINKSCFVRPVGNNGASLITGICHLIFRPFILCFGSHSTENCNNNFSAHFLPFLFIRRNIFSETFKLKNCPFNCISVFINCFRHIPFA